MELCISQLALSRGAKLVVSTHGMLSPWALSDRKWKKRVALTYQKRIFGAPRSSRRQRRGRDRQCGIDVPIALIPNGIDVPDALPAKDPVDPDKYALFLSRLHPVKGLEQLIDAWATIRPGISLKIAGTGELIIRMLSAAFATRLR